GGTREADGNAHAYARTQREAEDGGRAAVPWSFGSPRAACRRSTRPFGRADRRHEPGRLAYGHVDVRLGAEPHLAERRSRRRPSGPPMAGRVRGMDRTRSIPHERLPHRERSLSVERP